MSPQRETNRLYTANCEIRPGMSLPVGVSRWALTIEYDGSSFQGFQRQASAKYTVQAELERALSKVANEPLTLVCAGRTDAGVHATQQVVHFDTSAVRIEKAWVEGVNTQLPAAIRVTSAHSVAGEFHARFSALARTYRYISYSARVRPAILASAVTWLRASPSVSAMQEAGRFLLGEHDFSAFRSSQCQARNPIRTVERLEITAYDNWLVMEIKANAFLHHMVRNIMGSLFAVGRGTKPPQWMAEILSLKDRRMAAATAPAAGLYFVGVEYPDNFALPSGARGPEFIAPFLQ